MASTYHDWRIAYDAACGAEPDRLARRVILDGETRIPGASSLFLDLLAAAFDRRIVTGVDRGRAAIDALEDVLRATYGDPAFAFLIPMAHTAYARATTHVTARHLARFGTFGDVDSDLGALPRLPAKFEEAFPPPKVSVWFSPDLCPDEPDEVAKVLGLPHFEGQIAYRVDVELGTVPQFVPTCFDAGLFEPWQEPPAGHPGPCGMTRHLETGERVHNEFVVKTGDVASQDVALVRLPVSGTATRVNRLRPDYLVER